MVENGFWGWLSSLLPLAGLELIQHPGVAESPGASMLPKSRGPPGLTAATGHTMIMATAGFSKFAGILSAALSQRHLSGFGIAQLEFHHLH